MKNETFKLFEHLKWNGHTSKATIKYVNCDTTVADIILRKERRNGEETWYTKRSYFCFFCFHFCSFILFFSFLFIFILRSFFPISFGSFHTLYWLLRCKVNEWVNVFDIVALALYLLSSLRSHYSITLRKIKYWNDT